MAIDQIEGWQRRLGWSFVYATIAVIASSIIVWTLSSMESPGAQGRGLSGINVATDVLGLPLAPGWVVVMGIFGERRAVHGGQIVLVWPLSLAIDSVLIFLVWKFVHRKASRELSSKGTLGLDR
jgi:hypothetical protein